VDYDPDYKGPRNLPEELPKPDTVVELAKEGCTSMTDEPCVIEGCSHVHGWFVTKKEKP
jgi:hypothetical protein